jgi:hypothetical protein
MLSAASRPTLAKKRKDGAATFHYGKGKTERGEGWASPAKIKPCDPRRTRFFEGTFERAPFWQTRFYAFTLRW